MVELVLFDCNQTILSTCSFRQTFGLWFVIVPYNLI